MTNEERRNALLNFGFKAYEDDSFSLFNRGEKDPYCTVQFGEKYIWLWIHNNHDNSSYGFNTSQTICLSEKVQIKQSAESLTFDDTHWNGFSMTINKVTPYMAESSDNPLMDIIASISAETAFLKTITDFGFTKREYEGIYPVDCFCAKPEYYEYKGHKIVIDERPGITIDGHIRIEQPEAEVFKDNILIRDKANIGSRVYISK